MSIDWTARMAALAGKYAGLANATGTDTLRESHATAVDVPNTPCALTLFAGFESIVAEGSTYLTGNALVDVLILLEPKSDVPRRYAAMLSWVSPALLANTSGVRLGDTSGIGAALPASMETALAGDSEVYAGLPWDLVRVRYRVPFLERVTLA